MLPVGHRGLDVGGGTQRGVWRPTPRGSWTVLDVQPGPGVDFVWDIGQQVPEWMWEHFDVTKATDVLHLVRDVGAALANLSLATRPDGRLIYTRTYLRPGYDDADRQPHPSVTGPPILFGRVQITPLGDLTTLLAQLVWERFRLTRPVIGAFMRHYRPRPINPDYPPYCLAWGCVETR